jgi:CMP-N,N'-diacetyllegionaminic acid synthase
MKILCSICARGGSKGVKNKNIRNIMDKPLIAHTILQARKSGVVDKIAVSSDSDEILKIAKEFGADICIKRPDDLASDSAAKVPAIRHCAMEAEKQLHETFDIFVDLDCTSPLREPDDIKKSIQLLIDKKCSNVITGALAHRSPYFNLVEINPEGHAQLAKKLDKPIVRRQDAPRCFDMNASIYVWNRKTLLNSDSIFQPDTHLYEMPPERSLDIDSELDFDIVNFIAQKRGYLS